MIKSRIMGKSFQAERRAGIKWGRMNTHGVCRKVWKFLSCMGTGAVSKVKSKCFLLDWVLEHQNRLFSGLVIFIKLGFRILDPRVW